jgi:hypothetical protein
VHFDGSEKAVNASSTARRRLAVDASSTACRTVLWCDGLRRLWLVPSHINSEKLVNGLRGALHQLSEEEMMSCSPGVFERSWSQ